MPRRRPGGRRRTRASPRRPGASAPMLGAKGDMKLEVAAAKARGDVVDYVPRGGAAPEAFDSAARWPECAALIGDIRDQSNCGCCWAFAGAEAASDRQCIATGGAVAVPLSAQDVCFNANVDGCDGGQIVTPWTYVAKAGAVTGGQYNGTGPFGAGLCAAWFAPHCHHHGPRGDDPYPAEGDAGCPSEKSPKGPEACDATASAGHDAFAADKHTFAGEVQTASGEAAIMAMIAEGGPVYEDFENYAGGIYHHVTGEEAGGHAVKFVGWGVENGTKYWKVANSWNPYWGEAGYFRILRGSNEGGIEDQVTGSHADAKWTRAGDSD
ncbi:transferase [Aureococcus anophagefferens]|nr:transferase [Aureococcus anophagefferens]